MATTAPLAAARTYPVRRAGGRHRAINPLVPIAALQVGLLPLAYWFAEGVRPIQQARGVLS